MRKIKHFFKLPFSIIFKIIIAIMMGLGLSMGKKTCEIEHKDNKTMETEK